jgi:hypothetical protein
VFALLLKRCSIAIYAQRSTKIPTYIDYGVLCFCFCLASFSPQTTSDFLRRGEIHKSTSSTKYEPGDRFLSRSDATTMKFDYLIEMEERVARFVNELPAKVFDEVSKF